MLANRVRTHRLGGDPLHRRLQIHRVGIDSHPSPAVAPLRNNGPHGDPRCREVLALEEPTRSLTMDRGPEDFGTIPDCRLEILGSRLMETVDLEHDDLTSGWKARRRAHSRVLRHVPHRVRSAQRLDDRMRRV